MTLGRLGCVIRRERVQTHCAPFLIRWLHAQPVDFWHFLGFARTPLKSGALRNLLLVLDPAAFEDALTAWLGVALPTEELLPVALDGKSLRGTGGIDERAQRLVAAYEHQTGIVLKQLVVPKDTNEQKAALVLLKQWVLTGRVITADALYCQQETCQLITDSGGDYVIPVKDNQPTLLAAISSEYLAQKAAFPPCQLRNRKAEHRHRAVSMPKPLQSRPSPTRFRLESPTPLHHPRLLHELSCPAVMSKVSPIPTWTQLEQLIFSLNSVFLTELYARTIERQLQV